MVQNGRSEKGAHDARTILHLRPADIFLSKGGSSRLSCRIKCGLQRVI